MFPLSSLSWLVDVMTSSIGQRWLANVPHDHREAVIFTAPTSVHQWLNGCSITLLSSSFSAMVARSNEAMHLGLLDLKPLRRLCDIMVRSLWCLYFYWMVRRVRVVCAWGGESFTAHCVRFSGSKNRILEYTVSCFNEFVTLDQCNVCVDLDELPAAWWTFL